MKGKIRLISLFCALANIFWGFAQSPTHLTTDLLEHTDRVFLDGYPANISLEELPLAIERYQLTEIRSNQPYLGWVVNSHKPNVLQTAYRILFASSKELLDKNEADMWDSGRRESDNSIAVAYDGKALQPATIYYWKVKTWNNQGEESEFSQIKSFITAKVLDDVTACYPLQISDEYPVAIKSLGKGHSFIDFGKDAFGQLKLTLTTENENDTTIIRLGECTKDGQVDRNPGGSIRYAEYTLPLMSGTHTYKLKIRPHKEYVSGTILLPEYIGEIFPFRYCEIHTGGEVVRQTVHYPFNETASQFHSSDSILNQVWDFCKYSVKANAYSVPYTDGDRERIPYEADHLIGQLCHYAAGKEYALVRYSHEYLLEHSTWPTEWFMHSVMMAWYDYLYTGNAVSLQKYYTALKAKTLTGLRESNGLISSRTGKQTPQFLQSVGASEKLRDIVDWPVSTPSLHIPCVRLKDDILLPTAKFKTGDEETWKNSDFNDADWAEIRTTQAWEKQAYDKYDGYASYRMHFDLPKAMPEDAPLKDSILIDLGQIDDADETYLNGILVGKTGRFPSDEGGFLSLYSVPRQYKLSIHDPAIRWDKENVLTVRVYDNSKSGGIMGLGANLFGETDGYVFTDYNTVVNAYHYQVLQMMSAIAGALGKTQEQTQLYKESLQVKEAVNKLLLDTKTGLYRDGIGVQHSSLHANMYPLAFGMAPEKNKKKIIDFIHSRGMACSVYGAQGLVEGIYNANDDAYGLQLLSSTDERSWYNMIREGSTISMEAWGNKYKDDIDWNHIWGAAAGNLIARKLMGIEPLEPGFKKIRIKPQPATLKQASITLPSVRGDIHVTFDNQPGERFVLEVEIPANSTAEVWLPKLSAKYQLTIDNMEVKGIEDGHFVKVDTGSGKHRFVIEKLPVTAIDREALVKRHTVQLDKLSDSELLQVGNGEIAFGMDATGLQTFYGNTMSHWGWHSVPCPVEGGHAALKLTEFDFHGRKLPYRFSPEGQQELYAWMRENPHRMNLGRLRFLIKKNDGQFIAPEDVKEIHQTLDLWEGVIESRYEIEGLPVRVETCVEPETGTLAVQVASPLIEAGRLQIEWAFPYGHHGKTGADWEKPDAHRTTITKGKNRIDFMRQLDTTNYFAACNWDGKATFAETAPHTFVLTPDSKSATFHFVTQYAQYKTNKLPTVKAAFQASKKHWPSFWKSGGAIDLSGSRDPRWKELERRIVLSQYLLAVNEAGSLPPQESGLYNNSGWNGKFHLEMHWWHGAHYGLWGRWPMMDKSLWWYRDILPKAKELAQSQGFTGARWPKMIGPDAEESPSGTGPLLIWQQPHPIFYAELEYRLNPTKATLEKWRDMVQQSAEFMVDFAFFDEATQHYMLGPPLATVPEKSNYVQSWNPTFELSYWRTGLRWAQVWRERLGLARVEKWDDVIQKLAPLPVQDGVYLSQENMPDTYTNMNWEHPSLIGPGGMLPGDGADPETVRRTVQKVWETWQWDRCWGWDFPMMAMAAARSGNPQMAVDALLHPSFKNAINRAGLSTGGPFPYFPTNGGILYAVALMAAGWDGAPNQPAPGFPNDGSWVIRSEGLAPAP